MKYNLTKTNELMTLLNSDELKNEWNDDNIKQIFSLISEGADPNSQDEEGYNFLMLAINFGSIKHLKFLLDFKGINIDAKNFYGDTALMMAATLDKIDFVKTLIEHNADVNIENDAGYSPLSSAYIHKNKDMISLLIKNNAELNLDNESYETVADISKIEKEVFISEIKEKIAEKAKKSKFNDQKTNELTDLMNHFLNEVFQIQFDNPNKDVRKLGDENIKSILNLITDGANPNVRNEVGDTPLMLACIRGSFDFLKELIDKGADVNALEGDGYTPLMALSLIGDIDKINLLLKHDAKVNEKNRWGDTALMLACKHGYIDIVNSLIESGVDIYAKNKYGKTAWDISKEMGNEDISNIFKEEQARLDKNIEETFFGR